MGRWGVMACLAVALAVGCLPRPRYSTRVEPRCSPRLAVVLRHGELRYVANGREVPGVLDVLSEDPRAASLARRDRSRRRWSEVLLVPGAVGAGVSEWWILGSDGRPLAWLTFAGFAALMYAGVEVGASSRPLIVDAVNMHDDRVSAQCAAEAAP